MGLTLWAEAKDVRDVENPLLLSGASLASDKGDPMLVLCFLAARLVGVGRVIEKSQRFQEW